MKKRIRTKSPPVSNLQYLLSDSGWQSRPFDTIISSKKKLQESKYINAEIDGCIKVKEDLLALNDCIKRSTPPTTPIFHFWLTNGVLSYQQ